MARDEVLIFALNISKRIAITEDGELGDIRSFVDDEGDETQDSETAAFAIIEWRIDQMWSCTPIDDYGPYQPQ